MRVIVRVSLVAMTMHKLKIAVKHRGRDNVGGRIITGGIPDWNEHCAENLYRSVIAQSCLGIDRDQGAGLLLIGDLLTILGEWAEHDHHDNNPAYHAKFEAKPSNVQISARLMVRSPIMTALDLSSLGPSPHKPSRKYSPPRNECFPGS
jgi:hypothetical protein